MITLLFYGKEAERKRVIDYLTAELAKCNVSVDYGTGRIAQFTIVETNDSVALNKYDKDTTVVFDLTQNETDLGMKRIRINPSMDDALVRFHVKRAIEMVTTLNDS